MAQLLESLPLTLETLMECQAPGFHLAKSQLSQHLGSEISLASNT